MRSGVHLSVFDFAGADALQREARDLAQRFSFPPSYISAGIDMLLTCARRGDPGAAEALLQETADAAGRTPGWHEWLWQLRLGQARAELALARDDVQTAVAEATVGIANCHALKRPKYEALALITRARALNRLGRTPEAIADARQAVALAGAMHDPAVQLVARRRVARARRHRRAGPRRTRDCRSHSHRPARDDAPRLQRRGSRPADKMTPQVVTISTSRQRPRRRARRWVRSTLAAALRLDPATPD